MCVCVPALAKLRLQSIIIDFHTDFLLVKNLLYATQLDTKMDIIGILYSSEKPIIQSRKRIFLQYKICIKSVTNRL